MMEMKKRTDIKKRSRVLDDGRLKVICQRVRYESGAGRYFDSKLLIVTVDPMADSFTIWQAADHRHYLLTQRPKARDVIHRVMMTVQSSEVLKELQSVWKLVDGAGLLSKGNTTQWVRPKNLLLVDEPESRPKPKPPAPPAPDMNRSQCTRCEFGHVDTPMTFAGVRACPKCGAAIIVHRKG